MLAIIKDAITNSETGEGTSYLATKGGKYWCDVIDVDAGWLARKYKEHGYH